MKDRNLTLDLLRLLLAAMVVAIHAGPLLGRYPLVSQILSEGIFRTAVPAFLVMNGYFLHAAVTGGKAEQWIRHILATYVVWTILYAPIWLHDVHATPDGGRLAAQILFFGYFHLWYLPAAAGGAALLMPMRDARASIVIAAAVAVYAAGIALQDIRVWQVGAWGRMIPQDASWLSLNMLFSGFPFIATGYILARENVRLRPARAAMLTLVGMAIVAAEARADTRIDPNGHYPLLAGQLLLAPAAFLLAAALKRPARSDFAGRLAAAVYFIHPMILIPISGMNLGSAKRVAATFALSLAIGALLVPVARRLVPGRLLV